MMMRHKDILYYAIAFCVAVGVGILSVPFTWRLLELAWYCFGHKLKLGFTFAGIIYFACWGLTGVCILALGRLLVRVLHEPR